MGRTCLALFVACIAIATACATYSEADPHPDPGVLDGGDAASEGGDAFDAAADADADANLPPSADGVLDETFAEAGATPAMTGRPSALAIQSDGAIVLAGSDSTDTLTVWRFLPSG